MSDILSQEEIDALLRALDSGSLKQKLLKKRERRWTPQGL